MFPGLANIGFTNPFWFLLATTLPLLVIAYLKKSKLKNQTVSSILLFAKLTKRQAIRKKIKPPFYFYLELLALALLCIASTTPTFNTKNPHLALLFDNSLSMQALTNPGKLPETRLEKAKTLASTWINSHDQYSYSIFTSSPQLKLVSENSSTSEALEKIKTISASFASDNLETSLSQISESSSYSQLLIVSDKSAEFIKADSNPLSTEVIELSLNQKQPNIFISNLFYQSNDLAINNAKITAEINYSGSGSEPIKIQLNGLKLGQGKDFLSPTVINTAQTTITSEKPIQQSFELPQSAKSFLAFKLDLSPLHSTADAILEDNSAWVTSEKQSTTNVLLIAPEDQPNNLLGLDRISNITTTRVSPQQFVNYQPSELQKFALLIFYRTAPLTVPANSSLFILPPTKNPLFSVIHEEQKPQITSWIESHPLTSYLNIPLIAPAKALIFNPPSWAQAVINSTSGSLLIAGESQGFRFACSGIELLPFEGPENLTSSILILNLINWLISDGTDFSSTLLSGSNIKIDNSKTWHIVTPAGETKTLTAHTENSSSLNLTQPGVYVLLANNLKQKSLKIIAANSFFPSESSTNQISTYQTPRYLQAQSKTQKNEAPLWPWLLSLALIFLAIQGVLAYKSKTILTNK